MSIRLVVTRGYGNGNFDGTIKDVVTRGYGLNLVFDPSLIPGKRFAMGDIQMSPKRSTRVMKKGVGRITRRPVR